MMNNFYILRFQAQVFLLVLFLCTFLMPQQAWAWPLARPLYDISQNDVSSKTTLRSGIVVVGIGTSIADVAWPVAQAVYSQSSLRPHSTDREVRILAGDRLTHAATSLQELFDLRRNLRKKDATLQALLNEIARRTQVQAVVTVTRNERDVVVEIYDVEKSQFESTEFRQPIERNVRTSWSALLAVLRERYVSEESGRANTINDKIFHTKESNTQTPQSSTSFLRSPWFWAALGAAVVGGVLAFTLTRDTHDAAPPVRIEWGAR